MGYRWKPSRTKASQFAQKMSEIDEFCREDGISASHTNDSYYFTLRGMRYYSTQRPIIHGTFPKPQGNKVLVIENFDERTFCTEIKREVWGYLEYEKPLTEKEATFYELVKGGETYDNR